MKHTPGPWHVLHLAGNLDSIVTKDAGSVADVSRWRDGEAGDYQESLANARLIAKAPEMYELLRECEAYFADRADAEYHTDGPPSGNEEMGLLVDIQEVLK